MNRDIAYTLITRIGTSLLSFVVILITTNWLGAEVKGQISLFMLNVHLLVMLNNFVGGPALVYLIPRHNRNQTYTLSITWLLLSVILFGPLLGLANGYSIELIIHLSALYFLQGLITVQQLFMWADKSIKFINRLNLLQVLLLASSLAICIKFFHSKSLFAHIGAFYISLIPVLLLSTFSKKTFWSIRFGFPQFDKIIEIVTYGLWVQTGNFAQLLNYRLSYYLLKAFAIDNAKGDESVGIYSTGVQVGEAFWVISRSMSSVQYAYISNESDKGKAFSITVDLLKVSFAAVGIALLPVLFLPEAFYQLVFGEHFGDVRYVLLLLSPGILAFAVSGIFSHYFSGIGLHHINAKSSILGLVATVAIGIPAIWSIGYLGAAAAASTAYIVSTAYQWFHFNRHNQGLKWKLVPSVAEVKGIWVRIRK